MQKYKQLPLFIIFLKGKFSNPWEFLLGKCMAEKLPKYPSYILNFLESVIIVRHCGRLKYNLYTSNNRIHITNPHEKNMVPALSWKTHFFLTYHPKHCTRFIHNKNIPVTSARNTQELRAKTAIKPKNNSQLTFSSVITKENVHYLGNPIIFHIKNPTSENGTTLLY